MSGGGEQAGTPFLNQCKHIRCRMKVAHRCSLFFLFHISDMAWLVAYSLLIHIDAKHFISSQPVTVSVVLGGKMGMTSTPGIQGLPRFSRKPFFFLGEVKCFLLPKARLKRARVVVTPNNRRVLSSCRSAPRSLQWSSEKASPKTELCMTCVIIPFAHKT